MEPIEKLSITLPRDLAEKVREKVATGEYASQSAVVRAALRVWQEREDQHERKRAALREKIGRPWTIKARHWKKRQPSATWKSASANYEAALSPERDRRSRRNSRLYWAGQSDSGETLRRASPREMSVALGATDIGRERPDIRPGLRSLPIQSYLVFYRLVNDTVEIVSVVHGSRDVDPLFGQEP